MERDRAAKTSREPLQEAPVRIQGGVREGKTETVEEKKSRSKQLKKTSQNFKTRAFRLNHGNRCIPRHIPRKFQIMRMRRREDTQMLRNEDVFGQARGQWNNAFTLLDENDSQSRNLSPQKTVCCLSKPPEDMSHENKRKPKQKAKDPGSGGACTGERQRGALGE